VRSWRESARRAAGLWAPRRPEEMAWLVFDVGRRRWPERGRMAPRRSRKAARGGHGRVAVACLLAGPLKQP